jgi:hypothetical protein
MRKLLSPRLVPEQAGACDQIMCFLDASRLRPCVCHGLASAKQHRVLREIEQRVYGRAAA